MNESRQAPTRFAEGPRNHGTTEPTEARAHGAVTRGVEPPGPGLDIEERMAQRLRRFTLAAIGVVAALGVLGLAGWASGFRPLYAVAKNLPAMVPNTALCFIVSAVALWLLRTPSGPAAARRFGQACALGVTLIGFVIVGEYLFGWQPGIHSLVFPAAVGREQDVIPGRPAILTAVNFSLLGLALLLLDARTRSGSKPSELLSVTAVLISLLGLIGHVCNVPLFYGWRTLFPDTGMSVPAVAGFTVLGAGALAARPGGGLMEIVTARTASGAMARRLLLAPVIIPLVIGWLNLAGQQTGIYNAELSNWLFAFLNILVFTLFIWWSARLLFRTEIRRRDAERDLQALNARLEQHVAERTAELARAVQAVRDGEQRVRRVLDTALDAVITADDQGRITSWNREAERIFGWSAQEIVGQNLAATIIPPQYRHAHEAGLKRFAATGEGPVLNKRIEITALHREGREFPVELAITPIRVGEGFMFSAFVRDITLRQQDEQRLRASLKDVSDLKAALDEHAIVAVTDPQGKITYVNDKFCAISKYSREELLGQDHRLINSGHHSKAFIRGLWTTIGQGRVWKGEIRNRAKDGSFYWVDTTIVPFLNELGKPYQYVAIRADITERKRAEEQRQASLKEIGDLKAALDEHAIVAVTDPQGKITYVNDKFCAISKYSREELLGQDHRLINSGHHSKAFIRGLWTTIGQGRVWKGEIRNRAKDGSFYWVDTTIVPFLNELGKPAQYVAIRADITERMQAMEKVHQLNTDLERRVRERTAQLETSNRELESFSYSVSHDLRAPLRHIAGFVELLREDLPPDVGARSRHSIQVITESAERMGTLIDNLLTFSRMGRAEVEFAQVDTDGLVTEVVRELEAETRGRDIAWEIAPLPGVVADRALLKQVWLNLLSNAVKYTRHRPRAEVTVGGAASPTETEFFVKDNGAGFDMKYVDKLFGVFQRLHLPDEFEGTGIGLANVRRIVARHGGRTWAEGRVDGGATFRFTIAASRKP